jgi:integrase
MLMGLARVSAAVGLRLDDLRRGERRTWLRLREKRGLVLDAPLSADASSWLDAYLAEAGLLGAREGWVFRAAVGRADLLGERPLQPRNVHHMLRRRAREARIDRAIGCHALRATGITQMLERGVRLEVVQRLAGHASPGTTRLYDRRSDAELVAGVDTAWL